MNALGAAVSVAATHRLTTLLVDDEICRPVREKVGDVFGDASRVTYMVNCPACVSVWMAALVTVLPEPVRIVLALSEGALLIEEHT